MNVLVTGADGFIGRVLRARLAGTHAVWAVTRGASPPPEAGVTWVRADLRDPRVADALPDRIDAVVSLAQSRHYRDFPARADDVFDVNLAALLRILDWARTAGVRRFVQASSANVYPRTRGAITEDHPTAPISFYGRTKRMAEMLVESYAASFPATVLRLFTVYGPGQRDMLVPELIARVTSGRAVDLEGPDGLALSPIFVEDAARVLAAAVESSGPDAYEVVNVGGDEPCTVRSIAETIAAVAGREVVFKGDGGPEPGGWVADPARRETRFPGAITWSLRDGLARTVAAPPRAAAPGAAPRVAAT